ncbi:MAG TPA: O-antigen ligase family protein [Roseiarcus sp.]|nr:O-antigen ligase family protein [Roseiarcus sp.]
MADYKRVGTLLFLTPRFALVAARRRVSALPPLMANILLFGAWAFGSIILGVIVGFAAVILPPTGAFGIVAVVGLFLLWATPDFPITPLRKTRALFVAMLIVLLIVPSYYALDIPSLPWISARRLVIFPLIMLFGLSASMSSAIRRDIVSAISTNRLLSLGLIGFFVMIVLSFLTSIGLVGSLSQFTDAVLTWLVPWLVTLYVVRSDTDVQKAVKIIAICAAFVCSLAIAERILNRHLAIEALPGPLLQRLMADNPSVDRMVNYNPYRDGMYRALSVFGTSLSLGEFAAIATPFGFYYAAYSNTFFKRLLGVGLIFLCLGGIIAAYARGGNMAFAAAFGSFAALWYFRTRRFDRHSIGAAIVAVMAVIFFTTSTVAVMTWRRAHNMVFGGGQASYSSEARVEQWEMSKAYIISNPFTGHGFSNGALIIGNGSEQAGFTIDSYVLSLLVETGIPSLIFFTLMLFAGIAYSAKRFLTDPSPAGALNGAFACSLIAYSVNRLVLSERENHILLFIMLGLIMVSHELHLRRIAVKPAPALDDAPVVRRPMRVGNPQAQH